MRIRRRWLSLAAYLTTGAVIAQLSACYTIAGTTIAPGTSELLIDANGRVLGIFNVCGVADVQLIDADGVPGPVLFTEDDLMHGCPITQIPVGG